MLDFEGFQIKFFVLILMFRLIPATPKLVISVGEMQILIKLQVFVPDSNNYCFGIQNYQQNAENLLTIDGHAVLKTNCFKVLSLRSFCLIFGRFWRHTGYGFLIFVKDSLKLFSQVAFFIDRFWSV